MRTAETAGLLVSTIAMMASDLVGQLSLPALGAIGPWLNYGAMGLLAYVLLQVVRDQRRESREMRDRYETQLLDAQHIRDRHLSRAEEDHARCREAHLRIVGILEREDGK